MINLHLNILEGSKLRLRALEPEDIEILYKWENDTAVWGISHTLLPFSKNILKQFIESQAQDIYQTKQTRFVMEAIGEKRPVGVIDLFEFDPYHMRAGVGILVYEADDRRKGFAREALEILIRYGFEVLHLHQLYCNIPAGNTSSQRLFEQCGFERCGERMDWFKVRGGWENEYSYQLIDPAG